MLFCAAVLSYLSEALFVILSEEKLSKLQYQVVGQNWPRWNSVLSYLSQAFFVILSDEKLLKLQYQVVGQKLATLKLKKAIFREQEQLGAQTNRGDAGQLWRQLDSLQQTIELGEWGDDDKPFIREQAEKLILHKRKLNEQRDVNLLAKVRHLESNIETEIQRRLAVERSKLQEERLQYRMRFDTQACQLQHMMQTVNESAATLQQIRTGPKAKKRRREASPPPTTSTAPDDACIYIPISDVEPDWKWCK